MSASIFDYINSILYKIKLTEKIHSNSSEYNQYMINRWLSMYSPDIANIINGTVNFYSNNLENQEHYNLLYNLIPKCRKLKINYLKSKRESSEDEELLDYCECNEVSIREIKNSSDISFNH